MKKIILLLLTVFTVGAIHAQEIPVERTQKVLMTKKTASWCSPCGGWGWDAFETLLDENIDNTIVLAAHYSTSSDVLTTPTGTALVNNFQSTFSRPAFHVNGNVAAGSSNGAVNKIKDAIAEAATNSPIAQTGIRATYATGSRTIDVATRIQFFEDADGEFRLGVYIVKKSIISFQQSRGNNANHKEVLRDAITDNAFGDVIATGDVFADMSVERQFSFDLDVDDELSNYKILTLIWQKDEDVFKLINSNITDDITEAVINNLDETVAQSGFAVYPTTFSESATVQLTLTEKATVQMGIYAIDGRLLKTVFIGNLNSGEQRFDLNSQGLSAGIYFVRLQIGERVLSRQIIIR